MKKSILRGFIFSASVLVLASCGKSQKTEQTAESVEEAIVNVYTHRHYDTDKMLFEEFTKETGIQVNVVSANADELMQKLALEGERSPADVLITVDAGRLVRAKERNLLRPIESALLSNNIPAHLRDSENYWFGLTTRARVIVYDKTKVNPSELSTYEDLTNEKWKGRLLIRSSENIYNQSLLASIIAHNGADAATAWARGMVANFAQAPKGGDRDQIKAIAAGSGDIAVVNTYYLGKMLDDSNEEERKSAANIGVFFPNQSGRGTHINVSGAGVTKYSPHPKNATKFIEFLASDKAQELFAQANHEYPVKPGIAISETLKAWGEFKADELGLENLGKFNSEAVMIFDRAGWK